MGIASIAPDINTAAAQFVTNRGKILINNQWSDAASGKALPISKAADVPLAVDCFRYMAGWVTKIEGNPLNISAPGKYFAYTVGEPIGVVGQIIPWNFPLLMAAWKLAPALAAGCCVV